jgi:excisionase family DNA binding protein
VNQQRMTVHDAARRLGISEDAVRMRVKRGTLEAEREGGRLYVMLDTEPTTEPTDRTDELIGELRDRVRSLEGQLDQERDANRENRRIIAALTSRIPELPPPAQEEPRPQEEEPYAGTREYASEATPTPQPGRVGPQDAIPSPQEGAQPRSWWRRVFGR